MFLQAVIEERPDGLALNPDYNAFAKRVIVLVSPFCF